MAVRRHDAEIEAMKGGRFRDGMRAALPIVLGYLPVGMTFGMLASR
jgi:predicted branched-subunit amino acid permease